MEGSAPQLGPPEHLTPQEQPEETVIWVPQRDASRGPIEGTDLSTKRRENTHLGEKDRHEGPRHPSVAPVGGLFLS